MDPLTILVFGPLLAGLGARVLKSMRRKADAMASQELRRQRASALKMPAVVERRVALASQDGLDYLGVARQVEASGLPRAARDNVLGQLVRRMVNDQDRFCKLEGLL